VRAGRRGAARVAAVAALSTLAAALATALPSFPGDRPEVAPAYERAADRIAAGELPYRDFFLEYPPGALLAFVAPGAVSGDYDTAFVIVSALALAATAGVGAAVFAGAGTPAFAALAAAFVLALGPVSVTRYDAAVALAVTAGVALVVTGRAVRGLAVLAAAVATKLTPLVLVPLVALHVRRAAPGRLVRAAAAFVLAGAAITLPFLLTGPGGVHASLRYQLERPLHLESAGGSLLLLADATGLRDAEVGFEAGAQAVLGGTARVVAGAQLALLLAALGLLAAGFLRSSRSREELVGVAAAALALVVALGTVLSPQFLVWLFPLVLVAAARRVAAPLLLACVLTQVLYPNRYEELVAVAPLEAGLLVLRNTCLLLVAALLLLPWLTAGRRRAAGTG
jgi:hypothetical protein